MQKPLTIEQVAKLYRVHPLTVHRWLRRGLITSARIPGTKRHFFYASNLHPQPEEKAA